MSQRDQTPYTETTGTLPDGTELIAAQNLTPRQLDLVRMCLRQRRTKLTLGMVDVNPEQAPLIESLIKEAKEIDHLLLSLYNKRA